MQEAKKKEDEKMYVLVASGAECHPREWLNIYQKNPDTCRIAVLGKANCSKTYFVHATNGDGNCACVTGLQTDCTSPKSQVKAPPACIYRIPQSSGDAAATR